MIGNFRRPLAGTIAAAPAAASRDIAAYYPLAIVLAIALGVVVRAYPVLRTDFPLNDGGMFYAMVRDLQHANFALPASTTYNGTDIPFAYSPLAFYIAGVVDKVTPFGLTFWFRFLPLTFSCLTLIAIYSLATTVLRSRAAVLGAVIAFALIPRSYIWLDMGGGLTRSLGMVFAIFALREVYLLYNEGERRHLLPAILLSAGCVLSHLETGWFLAFSIAVFWIFLGHNRRSVGHSILLAGGVVVATSPWWLTVIAQHGLAPFVNANGTGGTIFSGSGTRDFAFLSLARVVSTSEPYFPVLGALGLLGAVASAASRRFLLPAWWASIILLDVRSYATYSSVPVALLAGVALAEAILPLLRRGSAPTDAASIPSDEPGGGRRSFAPAGLQWASIVIVACGLYYLIAAAFVRDPSLAEAANLQSLSAGDRAAFAWTATNTPTDAKFLVMPRAAWEIDRATEWFPALAQRQSVVTVQGSEWLANNAFEHQIYLHDYAWSCSGSTADCIMRFAEDTDTSFDYVVLPADNSGNSCCGGLGASLTTDGRFEQVYTSGSTRIFKLLGAS